MNFVHFSNFSFLYLGLDEISFDSTKMRLDILNWLRLSTVLMVDLRFFFFFLLKRIRSIGDI